MAMTERQAWMKLAKLWDKAKKSPFGDYEVDRCLGLCLSIALVSDTSWDMNLEMSDRLDKHRPRNRHTYSWPTTKAGAKSRAAFCRDMAAMCLKEQQAKKRKPAKGKR